MNNENKVWPEFLRRVLEPKKGDDIILIGDSTNLSNKYRIYYAQQARSHYDKLVLAAFDVPYALCQQRNKQRTPDHVVPDAAMERMLKEFEPISEETRHIYDEIIILDENGKVK